MCAKMTSFSPDSLLLPHRVWKVKFVGESSRVWRGVGVRGELGDPPDAPQGALMESVTVSC